MQMRAAGMLWDVRLWKDGLGGDKVVVQPITPKRINAKEGVVRYKAQVMAFATQEHRTSKGKLLYTGWRRLAKQAIEAYDAEVLPND